MKKEELIGKKVRGFRFESNKNYGLQYMPNIMDKYVGKEGVIEQYNIQFDSYRVKFEDGMSCHYPVERIEHHLVDEEPTIEINYNHISVKICEDNSLIGYYTDDCGITSFGKTFDELLRNLQHAKKAIEESREKLAKEDLERFEKSLDQSTEEFINDANRNIIDKVMNEEVIEMFEKELEDAKIKANKGVDVSFDCKSSNDLKLKSLNESCIDYGKIEHDPLDDLPIIGEGVLMEVSDDEKEWHERNVVCKLKNNSFLAVSDNGPAVILWNFARPIPKTKISRKEFESKFEIID
jgi:predicted RNase H-like HicB family nuclease